MNFCWAEIQNDLELGNKKHYFTINRMVYKLQFRTCKGHFMKTYLLGNLSFHRNAKIEFVRHWHENHCHKTMWKHRTSRDVNFKLVYVTSVRFTVRFFIIYVKTLTNFQVFLISEDEIISLYCIKFNAEY